MNNVFILLFLFQIKHFVADYPLQGRYMLGKFKDNWGFFLPLLAHVGVHGIFTLTICLVFTKDLHKSLWLALIDMIIHFAMDRIKAGKKYLGRFKPLNAEEYRSCILNKDNEFTYFKGEKIPWPKDKRISENKLKSNKWFWWSIGIDQGVHHLTHYFIIWCLIS